MNKKNNIDFMSNLNKQPTSDQIEEILKKPLPLNENKLIKLHEEECFGLL